MKPLTLWQRICADTPAFFKRAQIFGIGLVTLATSLAEIDGLPKKLVTILITAGTTITAVSQFAVNQYQPNQKQP